MILTSPSEDAGQSPPVTTTFDAPEGRRVTWLAGRRRAARLDWDRVERLHSFVRTRALERLREAELARDVAALREHRQSVCAIDAMFAQAQHGHRVVASCAVMFFRARAMRDAQHPDFLGEWLGNPELESRSA